MSMGPWLAITMYDTAQALEPIALLRLQSWLSSSFPVGSYSYSHGLEWAVDAGLVHDRASLVHWLEADLLFGTGRNEALLFREAYRRAAERDVDRLLEITEFAAACRGTSEFALEASQQGAACLAILGQVWPDPHLQSLAVILAERQVPPSLAVVLGVRLARQNVPSHLALCAFLHSHVANWVTAGVRLIPLGQTDGQLAIAELEPAVLAAGEQVLPIGLEDFGSAALGVDLASMAHETQYTRLFRS
jgi:urease accessory protein